MSEIMANSNHAFLSKFYKQLRSSISENICLSPFSIGCALGMGLMGMKNNTAKQVQDVLQIPGSADAVHAGFQSALENLKGNDGVTITTGNKVYIDSLYEVLSEFVEGLQKFYLVTLQKVDFAGKSEEARLEINKWVEDNTNGMIKDLLMKGVINDMTRIVLVNTIYFKGFWNVQFKKEKTNKEMFHLTKDDKIEVDMMHMNEKLMFGMIRELNVKVCQLFYKGKNMSMVILLPDEIDGLSKLESALDENTIKNAVKDLCEIKVNISMPKFKLECSFSAKDTLQKLGVTDMFEGHGDLSGISASNNLYVSDIVHKAVVEVNEEGTEAAAATGMIMMMRCAPMEMHFVMDHPFMFAIMDHSTNCVLFSGSVTKPQV